MGLRDHIPGARKANIGDAGRLSEKRLATKLNGRLTPASGAVHGCKGDIVLPEYLIEAKSTLTSTLSLKWEWLSKITYEALGRSKVPALAISFVDKQGKPVDCGEWVALPRYAFQELIQRGQPEPASGD